MCHCSSCKRRPLKACASTNETFHRGVLSQCSSLSGRHTLPRFASEYMRYTCLCWLPILIGCGITVYVAQHSDDWTFNASVTLDSYFQTLASLPSPSVASTYNISIYDVQSLSIARHNLSLTLLSFYNSSGTEYPSSIYFDYAAISEQCLSPSRYVLCRCAHITT